VIKYIAVTVSHTGTTPPNVVRTMAYAEAKQQAKREHALLLTDADAAKSATVERIPFMPGVSQVTSFTYEIEIEDGEA